MTEIESKVVAAWRRAAVDLGIRFSSPFSVVLRDGHRVDCIGFVHRFGRRVGTMISVLDQPSSLADLVCKWRDEDYSISVLAAGYGSYDRRQFIDTLDDWQFFGAEADRPAWYSGKAWGQA